ncbi:hypothetical protein C8R43DRAFT_963296 [Mycena crocata]|nr:hypothetical protein C8R43DRAFT_963296 [Mycena crocata]
MEPVPANWDPVALTSSNPCFTVDIGAVKVELRKVMFEGPHRHQVHLGASSAPQIQFKSLRFEAEGKNYLLLQPLSFAKVTLLYLGPVQPIQGTMAIAPVTMAVKKQGVWKIRRETEDVERIRILAGLLVFADTLEWKNIVTPAV